MQRRKSCLLLSAALLGPVVFAGSVAAADSATGARVGDATTLRFNGVDYVYRWAKAGQYEFLPPNDSDLSKWSDMVTINLHETATTGEKLAEIANKVLANYQRAGKIVRTDSKPKTATASAEHLIVAVLGSPDFLEAAFARLMLVDGAGVIAVYSHRIYGKAASPAMSDWLKSNGPKIEAALKTWDRLPASTALKKLPPRD